MEASEGAFHGIAGANNLFAVPDCVTDRFWRKSLALTPERYIYASQRGFDECDNAFMKPKPVVYFDVLEHLHKYADYE